MDMNTKKIKVGMRIKNYSEFCNLLGVKVRNGKQKKKQLKDFERFFEWKKDRYAFIITKVYNKPKAFTEDEMIELMILNLLVNVYEENKYSIIATKRNIFEKLHMVNENFKHCLYNPDELAIYKGMDEDLVEDVVRSIDKSLDNKLTKALENLSNRRVLVSTDVYVIESYKDENKNFYDRHRLATDEEISKCTEIEYKILKELNCKSYEDILIRKIQKKFYSIRKKALLEIGVGSFYLAKKLVFFKSGFPEILEGYLYKYKISKRNYKKYSAEINKGIQEQTSMNAQKRQEKAILFLNEGDKREESEKNFEERLSNRKKCTFGTRGLREEEIYEQKKAMREYERELNTIRKMEIRANDDYMEHVDTLIKILINSSTESLIEDIENALEKYKNKNLS
jgi:hypothetical protein